MTRIRSVLEQGLLSPLATDGSVLGMLAEAGVVLAGACPPGAAAHDPRPTNLG